MQLLVLCVFIYKYILYLRVNKYKFMKILWLYVVFIYYIGNFYYQKILFNRIGLYYN